MSEAVRSLPILGRERRNIENERHKATLCVVANRGNYLGAALREFVPLIINGIANVEWVGWWVGGWIAPIPCVG